MSDPTINPVVVDDRWRVRCDRCGGPVDASHREVVGQDPDLGWTQRVYCRACVVAVPDIGR